MVESHTNSEGAAEIIMVFSYFDNFRLCLIKRIRDALKLSSTTSLHS